MVIFLNQSLSQAVGAADAEAADTSIFLIIAAIGFAPWPFFIGYALKKLRDRLAAMAAGEKEDADAGADGDDGDDEGAEGEDEAEKGEGADQVLNDFLDQGFTKGVDDSDQIDINPVMTYKMNQAKKRQAQIKRAQSLGMTVEEMMAQEASGVSTGGGGGEGKPGALKRLGFTLKKKKKGAEKDDEKKNVGIEIKGIEMYLARDLEIDTKHEEREEHHLAGQNAMNPGLLAIATSGEHVSNLGRVGGRRGSTLGATAQKGRQQLAALKESKPDLFKPRRPSGSSGGRASSQMDANDLEYRQKAIAKARGSVSE